MLFLFLAVSSCRLLISSLLNLFSLASMSQLTLTSRVAPELLRTEEQSMLSSMLRFFSKRLLESTPRYWRTGRSIRRSSAAISLSATKNVTLTSASVPVYSWRTILGGVYVKQKRKFRALLVFLRATWSVAVSIFVIFRCRSVRRVR